jgi:formate dehydrogenase major subunit
MTNHWIDLKNSDCYLIMGSNAAEHHPICFKWVLRGKEQRGAKIIHVDPKFSRTSARSDFHVPLRSGTDIAFLGGMIKYILDNDKYFKEYVVEYTNAPFIVGSKFNFKDGMFSGFDPKLSTYDKSAWAFEVDANGVPKRDKSLKNDRCVFQLLKKHYSRYDINKVSDITGVSKENLLKVYEAFAATGKPNKVGTVMYALGWTQHTVGVQNIRTSAIIQLLLGNIGMAGGGINALRGEPNVQGSTDHCILYHILPGYLGLPRASWPTLADYNKANTPVSKDPMSANWWQNKPKYMASLLKAWFGDKGTKENGFGYEWLPKGDVPKGLEQGDYSYLWLFDKMYKGKIRGGSIWATNPAQSVPNSNKVRSALDNLDWLYFAEIHQNETTDFWHRPGVNPKNIKTEVFLFPSCHRAEKEGSISNSGRWALWHHKATEPRGESKPMGQIMVEIINKVRALYQKEGGVFTEPILNLNWPEYFDAEQMARAINGYYTSGPNKGKQVANFAALADDGSTACLNWLYSGSYPEEGGNLMKRRDKSQTDLQAKIGLFPNFSWCWPVNRRILYNRASVDKNGRPWDPNRIVIEWDGSKWIGDVPDGGWPPIATGQGRYPFIMQKEGHGQLYGPGREDGPFPEHYEPIETPVKKHPFSKQLNNPCAKIMRSAADKFAAPADPRYPIVLTTYSLTEHWCGGGETRNVPSLLEAEPQLYVEMSEQLAKEKGIKNGDPVVIESARGRVEAVAMVTMRMTPFKVQGKTIHEIGMPFAFGWTTPGVGDATNRLCVAAGDPNTTIPEYKACCVNIKKAEKLTELS